MSLQNYKCSRNKNRRIWVEFSEVLEIGNGELFMDFLYLNNSDLFRISEWSRFCPIVLIGNELKENFPV